MVVFASLALLALLCFALLCFALLCFVDVVALLHSCCLLLCCALLGSHGAIGRGCIFCGCLPNGGFCLDMSPNFIFCKTVHVFASFFVQFYIDSIFCVHCTNHAQTMPTRTFAHVCVPIAHVLRTFSAHLICGWSVDLHVVLSCFLACCHFV